MAIHVIDNLVVVHDITSELSYVYDIRFLFVYFIIILLLFIILLFFYYQFYYSFGFLVFGSWFLVFGFWFLF